MLPNCTANRYPSCMLLFKTSLICLHSQSYRLLCPSCQEPREPCNRYCRLRNLEPYNIVRQHHCKGQKEAEQQMEEEEDVEEEEQEAEQQMEGEEEVVEEE